MDIVIEEDNSSESSNQGETISDFKKRWSRRGTDSVQEITMQHLESINQKNGNLPEVAEHNVIYNDFKKVTYKDIEKEINDCYLDENHNFSSSLDILASYLKGQKII